MFQTQKILRKKASQQLQTLGRELPLQAYELPIAEDSVLICNKWAYAFSSTSGIIGTTNLGLNSKDWSKACITGSSVGKSRLLLPYSVDCRLHPMHSCLFSPKKYDDVQNRPRVYIIRENNRGSKKQEWKGKEEKWNINFHDVSFCRFRCTNNIKMTYQQHNFMLELAAGLCSQLNRSLH